MSMSTMKRNMLSISAVTALLPILFYMANIHLDSGIWYSLFITSLTVFYHFTVRLIAGYILNMCKHHTFTYDKGIFRGFSFEKRLYKFMGVKKWKNKMPTFNPASFSMNKNSPETILNTMCISELVHLINVPLSFVPVAVSLFVQNLREDLVVFLITSILAASFDMVFVIMQRYNRPRIVKLLNRQNRGKP